MPHQLEFWIREQPAPPASPRWEDLDVEQRAALITMLARLIGKAVHPRLTHNEEKEEDHER